MKSEALPVTVVGGYLGCGKTTLINHLLRQCGNKRLAVLVNDFGQLPIDADLIESRDGNVISLSGGCICCSYGNDLSMALMDIIDQKTTLDELLIETSGVALPDAIASSLTLFDQLQLQSILVLVNGETIREQINDRYIGDTIHRQLENADIVVINKTDLIESDDLLATEEWLQEDYPESVHIATEQARVPVELFFDMKPDGLSDSSTSVTQHRLQHKSAPSRKVHDASAFNSFTLDVSQYTNLNELMQILKDRSLQLVRAKGYWMTADNRYLLIQIVGSRAHFHDVDKQPAAKLIGKLACITLLHGATKHDVQAKLRHLI